ncbi:hypothetical protein M918_08050 [Clostridium sp. BL8]|nr:hypothetical protein M918_08050 [Clostridium sp. BL8]
MHIIHITTPKTLILLDIIISYINCGNNGVKKVIIEGRIKAFIDYQF